MRAGERKNHFPPTPQLTGLRGGRAARPLAEGGRVPVLPAQEKRYARAGKRRRRAFFMLEGKKIQNGKLFYWPPPISQLKTGIIRVWGIREP